MPNAQTRPALGLSLRDAFALARRSVLRRPVFVTAITLPLAISIAIGSAASAVVQHALFPRVPFSRAHEIVHVAINRQSVLSAPSYRDAMLSLERTLGDRALLTEQTRIFNPPDLLEHVEASTGWELRPTSVSGNFFSLFDARPLLGRALIEDDRRSNPRPIVISYGLWTRHFGANPTVLNTVVDLPGTVGNVQWLVVGVMRPDFDFPKGTTVWTATTLQTANGLALPTFARLAPDATVADVRRRLNHAEITSLADYLRPRDREALVATLVVVGLVMCLGWTQAGAALLARAATRQKELAIHASLGADLSTLRRVRRIESLLLAGVVGGIALALTAPSLFLLRRALGNIVDVDVMLRVSSTAFAFTVIQTVIGALLLSVASRLPAVRIDGNILRTGSSTTRVQPALRALAGQLAVATTLIYLTGATGVAYQRLHSVDLGFDPDGLLVLNMPRAGISPTLAPIEREAAEARHKAKFRASLDLLTSSSAITGAATGGFWPLQPDGLIEAIVRPEAGTTIGAPLAVSYAGIATGYATVARFKFLEGREPTAAELLREPSSPVGVGSALINASLARRLTPDGRAVGMIVRERGLRYRIAGVVADVVVERPDRASPPLLLVYYPATEFGYTLILRSTLASGLGATEVAGMLRPIWSERTPLTLIDVADTVASTQADYRSRLILLTWISTGCLLISCFGMVGTLRGALIARRREMLLRFVLGATSTRLAWVLMRSVLPYVLGAVLVGLAAGVTAAVIFSRYYILLPVVNEWATLPVAIAVGLAMSVCLWSLQELLRNSPSAPELRS